MGIFHKNQYESTYEFNIKKYKYLNCSLLGIDSYRNILIRQKMIVKICQNQELIIFSFRNSVDTLQQFLRLLPNLTSPIQQILYNSERKPKQMKELVNKVIALTVYISKHNQQLALAWQAIKLFNIIIFLIKLLENYLKSYFANSFLSAPLNIIYEVISGRYPDGSVIEEIGYATAAMLVLLCGCLAYYFCSEMNTLNRTKKRLAFLFAVYYPISVLLIVELLYPAKVLYLIKCFAGQSEENSIAFYVSVIMSAVLVFLVTLFNSKCRIFSLLFPVILILVSLLESLIANIFLIIVSIPFAYRSKQLIDRCSYVFFSIVSIFNIMEHFDEDKKISSLIYLALCLFLSGLIMVVKNAVRCDTGDQVQNNRFLVECIKKLQKNSATNLENHILIKLESIFRIFYEKYQTESENYIDFPIKKQIGQLEYDELLKLVDFKLKITSLKSPTKLKLKQQFLLFRIRNIYKIYESLNQISEFMDYGKNDQSMSYAQKYARKYVELQMLQIFLSKQSGNEKIQQIKKLSQIQKQFVDESVSLMVSIRSFWDQVNTKVLIEEIIEEEFYSVVTGIEKLKDLLNVLNVGYNATWQAKLYEMITKLAYPDNSQFVPLVSDTHLGRINQDTLSYFVVRNRDIVQASSAFLKIINGTKYQIVGSYISTIMPEKIIDCIKQRQTQAAITSKKASNIIPIVCNDYLIKVYEANVKLQSKANSGIEFFYFLNNVEKEQKRAYLYLSSIDLRIQYVSQQFFEILGLKPMEIEKIIRKSSLYLDTFVKDIDRSMIFSELLQKNSFKCEVFTENLISESQVGKPKKLNGIVSLENMFEDQALLSLHVISPAEATNHRFLKSRKNINLKTNFLNIKTTQSDIIMKTHKKQRRNNTKNESYKEIFEQSCNQTNFCPIENPYKQKIQEMKYQISQQNRSGVTSYTSCSIILSVALMLLFIVIAALLIAYCRQQNNTIDSAIEAFKKASTQTNFLIQSTFDIYTQYILYSQKQAIQNHINSISSHGSVTQYLQVTQKLIHETLHEFQKTFTSFYNRQIFKGAVYQIIYPHFSIQTDLSTTNLIEYTYNIKMAHQKMKEKYKQSQNMIFDEEHPLTFLIKNYPIISNLRAPYDSTQDLLQLYFVELNSTTITLGVVSFFALIGFCCIVNAVKRNLDTVKVIFHIFSLIENDLAENRFQQIRNGLKMFTNNIPKDSLKKLTNLNKAKEAAMITYSSEARSARKKLKSLFPQSRKEEEEFLQNKHVISNKVKPYISVPIKMKGYFITIILFFGFVGGFFYKMSVDLHEDRINLGYYSQIEKLIHGELKNSADMFYYNILINVFDKSAVPPPQVRQKKSTVDKFLSEQFVDSFRQFYQKQSAILKQNLCQVSIGQAYVSGLMECEKIGLGILQKGYIQTSEYYDFKTEKMKQNIVGLTQVDQNEKYMNLFIHLYIREKLIYQFKQFRSNIDQNRQQLQQKYSRNIVGFGIGLCALGAAFSAYLILDFVPALMKIRKIGIGYFKILPKEVLSKIIISAYIKQNDLLNRIALL